MVIQDKSPFGWWPNIHALHNRFWQVSSGGFTLDLMEESFLTFFFFLRSLIINGGWKENGRKSAWGYFHHVLAFVNKCGDSPWTSVTCGIKSPFNGWTFFGVVLRPLPHLKFCIFTPFSLVLISHSLAAGSSECNKHCWSSLNQGHQTLEWCIRSLYQTTSFKIKLERLKKGIQFFTGL